MPTKKVTTNASVKKTVSKNVAKVAPKKTVKKTPVKSSTKKKSLVYAGDHESFWVTNGQILNSLVALRDALDAMENEIYSYHAGKAHNDFANWVEEVLADKSCASELKKAKTAKTAKTVVVKHLKLYAV